jgi:hypothetical protein
MSGRPGRPGSPVVVPFNFPHPSRSCLDPVALLCCRSSCCDSYLYTTFACPAFTELIRRSWVIGRVRVRPCSRVTARAQTYWNVIVEYPSFGYN